MPYCIVKTCKNYSSKVRKEDGVSYFHFPRNAIRFASWRSIISESRREEYFMPKKANLVCSDHFKQSDMYFTSKGLRRLKQTAVPTLRLNNDENSSEDNQFDITTATSVLKTDNMCGVIKTDTNVAAISSIVAQYDTISPDLTQEMKKPSISTFMQEQVKLYQKSPSTSLSMGSILDTPRKIILKRDLRSCKKQLISKNKKINSLQKVNQRLKKKNISLKNALTLLKKQNGVEESLLQDLSQHLEVTETFNALYLKNVKNKKRPFAKYPPGARKFAITLHFYSPAAYKYLRRMFNSCLPHPSTLYDWYRSVEAEPGFTAETLDRLKEKSKNTSKEIMCAMIVDEMSIRHQKIWNGKKYEGLVDLGIESSDSNEIATQAYVILLVSINDSWKIPLAYFLITSLTAEMKSNIIKLALTKCHMSGVKIISLTFDGCKSNIATMKLLGCDIADCKSLKTNFQHPIADYEVVVFLDACHMIKLMRNTLEAKRIFYDLENKPIKWKFFTDLHKIQEKHNLHLANKLTHRHIAFRNEIMKVRLATQLFSKSVAKAIEFCDTELQLPEFKDASATIHCIELLNDVFDILNSRNFNNYGFKQPFYHKNADKIIVRLEQAKQYLNSLTVNIKRKRTLKKNEVSRTIFINENIPLTKCQSNTGVIGLLVCIQSIQYLYKTLVITSKLSFLTTYKFSQDHVELFFGNIRSQGGFNNNPNSRQFKSAYKKLLMHLELGSKFSGNAIPLENIPILTCGNTVANINNSSVGYRYNIEQERACNENIRDDMEDQQLQGNCDQLSSAIEDSDIACNYIDQIVGYFAGFVVRCLLKGIKCSDCKKSLLATDHLWFHKLVDIKTMGGLFYAAEDVFKICKKTEEIIRRFSHTKSSMKKTEMCNTVIKTFIQLNVFQEIHLHSLEQPAMFNHRITLIKAAVEKYIDVRLHYIGKKETSVKRNASKRQLYNKLNLFQGN